MQVMAEGKHIYLILYFITLNFKKVAIVTTMSSIAATLLHNGTNSSVEVQNFPQRHF